MSIRFNAAAAAAALFATLAYASEDATVVVTATRIPSRVSEVLSDVTVIDHEALERAPQATLTELLHAQPGLQTWSTGGPGTVSSLSIRGSNPQQVVVLVDGQRLSSATLGTTAVENIPLNQVDRIEILRGPASALYGADAMGGVIQIFTRKGTGAPHWSAEAGLGSYRTTAATASYGGSVGDTSFNLTAGNTHSGSFSATKPGTFGFNPDRDAYANRNVSMRLVQRIAADHEVGAQAFYSYGNTHFDAANCDPAFTVCTNDFDNYQIQTLGSYSLYARDRFRSDWTSTLRIGRSEDRLVSYFLDPLAASVNGQLFRTIQDQYSWQNDIAALGGKLMLAAEQRREAVNSNELAFTVNTRRTNSLVAGYQTWIGNHSLQLAARHDTIYQFGSHATGSLAYGYQLTPDWRVSASAGTSFRAPTFSDLYWPVDFVNGFVGNPDLRPERARNREIGVVYESSARRASLTAYENRVSDLLNFGAQSAPPFLFTTVNIGSAILKGATVRYDERFGAWTAGASYDVLSARDADTGLFLIRRAKQHATAELRYDAGTWQAAVQMVATGSRFDDTANTKSLGGFNLVNVDARYDLDRAWSLIARVNNLFDQRYELVRGFNTPGASLFVGVRYAMR